IVAEYTADHRLMINKKETPIDEAQGYFRQQYADLKDKTLFVIGAGTVAYGEIMAVIDAAVGAGVEKVGIVTDGMRQAAMAEAGAGGQKKKTASDIFRVNMQ